MKLGQAGYYRQRRRRHDDFYQGLLRRAENQYRISPLNVSSLKNLTKLVLFLFVLLVPLVRWSKKAKPRNKMNKKEQDDSEQELLKRTLLISRSLKSGRLHVLEERRPRRHASRIEERAVEYPVTVRRIINRRTAFE